jgi:hypothetical protein
MGSHVSIGLHLMNLQPIVIKIQELCSHDVSQIGVGLCWNCGSFLVAISDFLGYILVVRFLGNDGMTNLDFLWDLFIF